VSLLVRLERRIEALVEGLFSRWGHDRTHALTKETAEGEEIDRTGRGRTLEAPPAPHETMARGPVGSDTRVYRRAAGTSPSPRLRIQAGPQGTAGREFALDRALMTIGRRGGQDIVLNDPSVSRAHARIEIALHEVAIVDLGSTNGTLVNGRPAGPGRVLLRVGDRIQIGSILLEYLTGP
jgi:hypothetical protein